MHFKSSISAHLEPSTDRILAFGQVRVMLYASLAVSQLPGWKFIYLLIYEYLHRIKASINVYTIKLVINTNSTVFNTCPVQRQVYQMWEKNGDGVKRLKHKEKYQSVVCERLKLNRKELNLAR